jgi:hypothetical protein
MNIVTFSLGHQGVTPPPVGGVVGWSVGLGATPPPPVDGVVGWSVGLGATSPPVDGVGGWIVGLGATPPPPVDGVVGCCSRKFREPADLIFSEVEAVSCILGLSPLRGPSCQTWFTVVMLLPSVSVANIVISLLFSNVAERFETPKLKAPSANVVA